MARLVGGRLWEVLKRERTGRMKKVITALVVVGLMSASLTALGQDGSYPDCLSSSIDYTTDTPRLTDTLEHRDDGAIRIGTTGLFFIVSYNNTGERGMILGDVLSIEVPKNAIAVEACMDGNVTFTFAPIDVDGEAQAEETEETTNLIEWWQGRGYNYPV